MTYQLLTGRVAHSGTIADLAQLEPPPPPSELADAPAGVDDVVLRGLGPTARSAGPTSGRSSSAFQAAAPGRARALCW